MYSVTQRDSAGGVHDRTAKMRYLGENSGFSGEVGGPEIALELITAIMKRLTKVW